MKKKLLKSVAVVMCIVIACLSMPLGSSAAGKVYTVDELEGYLISDVIINDSETIAIVDLNDGEALAVTKNGKDFTVLNFDKYLPKGSDFIEVFDFAQKDDLFVFFLRTYKTNDDVVLTSQIILTTTDCVSYKKYELKIDISDVIMQDIELGTGYKNEYRNLLFSEHTFVLAADFIKITKTDSKGRYLKGVYYTTTDFVNWTKHYTPELYQEMKEVSANDITIDYTSLGDDDLLVKFSSGDLYHIMYQKNVYIISDFTKSIAVNTNEGSYYHNIKRVCVIPNSHLTMNIIDVYDRNGDDIKYKYSTIELFDREKGSVVQIYKGAVTWWNVTDENNIYIVIQSKEGGVKGYVFDKASNKLVLKTDNLKYDLTKSFYSFGVRGTTLIFMTKNNLCVSTTGSPMEYNEYDISEYSFDAEYTEVFCLKGKLYVIGTFWDDGIVKVAETDITIQKKGDLNGDSQVNSTDALVILQSVVGKTTLSASQKSFADVNKDGKVNSTDALKILQFVVGKISSL